MASLTELPRVGAKTAARLVGHFGSEEAALAAIQRSDVPALAQVQGLGERGAVALVQEYIAHADGAEAGGFLRTPEAQRVYERLMGLLRGFAHTHQGRASLGVFFPLPDRCAERILQTQRELAPYLELAASLPQEAVDALRAQLRHVRPLRDGTGRRAAREQLVVVEDEARAGQLRERGLDRFAAVAVASDPREVADLARGYASCVLVGRRLVGFDLPQGVHAEYVDDPGHLSWMLPDATLDFYSANLQSLRACLGVIRVLHQHLPAGPEGAVGGLNGTLDGEKAARLSDVLSGMGEDGCMAQGTDTECDRLRSALDRLDAVVSRHLEEANQRLAGVLQRSSVTIRGEDILPLLGRDDDPGIRALLAREVRDAYRQACAELVRATCAELGLSPLEAQPLEEALPSEVTYPIQADTAALRRLRGDLQAALARRELGLRQGLARELVGFTPALAGLVSGVLELDASLAVGLFAREYGLTMPQVVGEPVLDVHRGRSIFLKSDGREAEPVSYALGVHREPLHGERVALLSGVNSGGKTSLLDLLAQCVVLGHMGFPVPAERLTLGLTEQFYYFSKPRGTLSAGAFEATLRNFAPVTCPGRKLVLADELEAITEPGASARIVAGILEVLHDGPENLAVVVSHLAEQIGEHCACPVRVDGIEASGLDASLNLVVDRNPRYHYLARSTPELIVERLVQGSAERDREFYQRLKAKFNGRGTAGNGERFSLAAIRNLRRHETT